MAGVRGGTKRKSISERQLEELLNDDRKPHISYHFTDGSAWPFAERPRFCDPQSMCGKIVPYVRNVRHDGALCQSFKPFERMIRTFRSFCRGQPIMDIQSGDNGLLEELRANKNKPKPTPARSRPASAPAPIPIPDPEVTATPAPLGAVPTPIADGDSTPGPVNSSTIEPTPLPQAAQPNDKAAGANAKTQSLASTAAEFSLVVVITAMLNLAVSN
ncbi:hypothetical protein ATCC90586_005365 [Pythium insidiosum]|nr:hypothetical protein ATCC90586_005365 [Pythium insidiosum]